MPSDPYRALRDWTPQSEPPPGPLHLRRVISEFVAARGLAGTKGLEQIRQAWRDAAGEAIGAKTEVVDFYRGIVHVGVANSALLNELIGFHRQQLLEALRDRFAGLRIRDIKFRLKTEMTP